MTRPDPPQTTDELLPLVYENLRELAGAWYQRQRSGEALNPTALVHEAYLRLAAQDLPQVQSRTHFFALAAREMRRLLVDQVRAARALKRGGGEEQVALPETLAGPEGRAVDILVLDEALDRLAGLHARQAQVVQARFFGGLTVHEVASQLGVAVATVEKDWRVARAWLLRELGG